MKYTAALTPDKFLSPQEEATLRAELERYRSKSLRDTTMILLMLNVGFRPSELLGLKWGDVNSGDKSIHVRTLKGGIDRVVPIGKNLLKRLQQLGRGADDELVFKVGYDRLHDIWAKYRPAKKSLHCLRHTFAVNVYKRTKDPKITQLILGHKNLATTDVYLQVVATVDEFKRAVGGD